MNNITKIQPYDYHSYETCGINKNCEEIKTIYKNGEMAKITWFQIIKNNKVIAEIKESACHVFGEDDYEESSN